MAKGPTCFVPSGVFVSSPCRSTLVPEGVRLLNPPTASATSEGTTACAEHTAQAVPVRVACKPVPWVGQDRPDLRILPRENYGARYYLQPCVPIKDDL